MNELAAQGTPDLFYLIFMIPPMLLAGWAQSQVKSRYMAARTMPASCTGAQAARRILDAAGLQNVKIEEIEGTLTDHYDPRTKVLRLSSDIYHGQTLAAVGIAAHEAGHAIQDATRYPLMVIRQMAVPMASIGGGAGMSIVAAGLAMGMVGLVLLGVLLFSGVAIFQLVNLPVEYNASARAKQILPQLGIVSDGQMPMIRKVLGAAALTYVAATLSAVMQVLYFVVRLFAGSQQRRR